MADKLKVGEVAEIVNQLREDNKSKIDFYNKVDKAIRAEFTPDDAIKSIPWIGNRHHGSTKIADARNAATRIFSSLLPSINIAPTSDNEYEDHRVETGEQVLEWEFTKMNQVGTKPIHTQLVEDAVTYNAMAFQVVDLEHLYKGRKNEPRIKALLNHRRFDWVRHHVGTVFAQTSDIGVEAVAKVADYSLQDLINKFGKDNEGVAKLLTEHPRAKKNDLMKIMYTLSDYKDWEHRVQFVSPKGSRVSDSKFVMMNEKHGMPFLDWVVVDFGEPLWKSLIMSGQFDNLQYLSLIRFAKAIEQGTRSTMVVKTPDGTLQRVWMDYSNPSNPIVLPLDGSTIDPLPPAPIDPQLENMYQQLSQEANSSTVSGVLQDASQYTNSPFSTLNAARNSALGQLSPSRACAETAYQLGFKKMIEWINFTDNPLMGYRKFEGDTKIKAEKESNKRGEVIGIFPTSQAPKDWDDLEDAEQVKHLNRCYFDPSGFYIDVKLREFSLTDEQARMNTQILAIEKMGASQKQAYENMGWKNFELIKAQRVQEQLDDYAVQLQMQSMSQEAREQMKQEIMAEMEAEAKAQQEQAQRSQPQNMVQNLNAQNQFASLQGADMRGGGMPSVPVAPNENRESINGNAGGEPML